MDGWKSTEPTSGLPICSYSYHFCPYPENIPLLLFQYKSSFCLSRPKSIQICLFLKASLDCSQMASLYPTFSVVPHYPLNKVWVPHSAWQCQLLQNQHLPTYLQPHQLPPYSIICFPENFMLFLSVCLKHPVLHMANSSQGSLHSLPRYNYSSVHP